MSDFESAWGVSPLVATICLCGLIVVIGVVIWAVAVYAGPIIVPAFGLAFHLAVYGITGAAGTVGGVSLWFLSLATLGIAMTGTALSIRVLIKITPVAEKNLYGWGLPLLSILSGFCVELCRDFSPSFFGHSEFGRTLFAFATGLLFFMAGLLVKQKTTLTTISGILLFALAPLTIIGY
ncbi:MAG TPA: hypothetical protein VHT92_12730, partial [Candidatus Cybelea sp.]|nr:hypothetical protein [Candidatus Cybelea sp.]